MVGPIVMFCNPRSCCILKDDRLSNSVARPLSILDSIRIIARDESRLKDRDKVRRIVLVRPDLFDGTERLNPCRNSSPSPSSASILKLAPS
jgi:hypothetical protein